MSENLSQSHTEFCAHQVHGPQIVQTFPQRVKPQINKGLVLDECLHIEYMDYLKRLCLFQVSLKVIQLLS